MPRLVVMLCPPRSFSSLVSTMIGQHPDIYGFPELVLMLSERVVGSMYGERERGRYLGPPGLLRTMSELMFGEQTPENVLTATNWLEERLHWRSEEVMQLMMDLAEQRSGAPFCIEKTPTLCFNPRALNRIRAAFPDALYVHVTRHPVSLIRSAEEYIANMPRLTEEEKAKRPIKSIWPLAQRNILDFCQTLAPGQYIRLRGEDVLSDGFNSMKQVAEFVGIRTDDEAVNAMLRPEDSPYACLGPTNAKWGNDVKFVMSPKFRSGTPRLPSLKDYLDFGEGAHFDAERKEYFLQIANCLGYQ